MRTAMLKDRGGFVIMGVVFAMMMFVLVAITGVSMLTNQSQASLNVLRMAQANAIRLGALEYIQKRLQYNLDWSALDATTESIVLEGQTTTVTYADPDLDPNRVDISSLTDAVLDVNHLSRRNQRFTVYRLPQASHYSFFRGNRTNSVGPVTLSGTIRQHAYFNESVRNGTFTDARLYFSGNPPTGSGFGPGSSAALVTDPQPGTPSFDWGAGGNEYDARIAQYDTEIMAARDEGKGDISIDTPGVYDQTALEALENAAGVPADDNDGVVEAQNFYINTTGDVVFQGPIKIVAHGDIRLQAFAAGDCGFEGTVYKSSDGGCKKIGTSDVWGAGQAHDDGTGIDPLGLDWAAADDYCSNVDDEGGYPAGSWTLPTAGQLQDAAADMATGNPFQFDIIAQRFWSSDTGGPGHRTIKLANGDVEDLDDAQKVAVVCVRASVVQAVAGTLEFQPTDTGIELVAGHSLVHSDDTRTVYNDPDTVDPLYFYSRNRNSVDNSSDGQMYITESTYDISGMPFRGLHNGYAMANRRLFAGTGSIFTRFLLYVPRMMPDPDPADLTWVNPRISNTEGMLTAVGTSLTGAIFSMSEASPNMRLQSTSTQGLVYSNGTDANGDLLLQSASNDGSVITNHLQADQMDVGNLTHSRLFSGSSVVFSTDQTNMPQSRMIDGFTGSVSVKEASWDGS